MTDIHFLLKLLRNTWKSILRKFVYEMILGQKL